MSTEFQPGDPFAEPEQGIDFKAVLWEKKWLIVFFAVIGSAVGYLQFSKLPPKYQSRATVLVEQNQTRLSVDTNIPDLRPKDPLDTHVALFKTPVILGRAVEDFDLGKLTSVSSANPVGTIGAGLSVSRSAESDDILNLSYTCGNQEDCRIILEAVVASYLDYIGESQKSVSENTLSLIEEAKEDLAVDLSEKEKAYQEFRENTSLLWTGSEGRNLHQERLATIESQRSQLMIQASQVRAEFETIKKAIERGVDRQALLLMAEQLRGSEDDASPQSLQRKSITGQLIPMILEESLLKESLGTKHPKVLETQKKIEVMKNILAAEAGESSTGAAGRLDLVSIYVKSLQEEMRIIDEKIKELDNLFLVERKASTKLGSEENLDRALREDLERTKVLFSVIVEQLQGINLTRDNLSLSGRIIVPPSAAYEINNLLYKYVGTGGLLGAAVGFLIGLLFELSDKRFRSPEQIMQLLNAPILGYVPDIPVAKKRRHTKGDVISPIVVSHHRPQSRIAEAYRLVRTSLLFDSKSKQCQIIQITSPDPGDGKSTMSSNVAVSLANSGRKCLLIDADLRRAVQHKIFGLEREPGVTNVVLHDTELNDAIQTTSIEHLSLMTAGEFTKHPNELLHSPVFAQMLEALRSQFDFIVVDSPPVLAVSDAATIAPLVDHVLLVIKNTKNAKPNAKQARENLELVSAPLFGVVVNAVSDETSFRYEGGEYRRGGYRYGSKYGYGYGGYSYARASYRSYYQTPANESNTNKKASEKRFASQTEK